MSALQIPACCFDQAGDVISINDAWVTYAGLSGEALSQRQWIELIEAEHRYDALSALRAVPAFSDRTEIKCRLDTRHAEARWFVVHLHRLDAAWLCTCTDIHDLMANTRELEHRASMQTDMLNVSVDCIKLIAPNGTLLHMNRAGCLALGVGEDSGFGMPWLPLLPEDIWVQGEAALNIARTGQFSRFPGRSVVPGQPPQYWDNMLTPILSATGNTTAIMCVSREVTRERAALDSVQRSEERLAIAARVGGLGVWDYDIALDVLHCDENWYRIVGRDPNTPIVSIDAFRPLIHPDDVDKATEVEKTAKELIASGQDYGIEFRVVRPSGEIRWVRSVAYLQQEDGVARRAVGFMVDITDARRAELALRDENRLLEDEKASWRRQSLEDSLTGIANRRHLNEALDRICRGEARSGTRIGITLIDIDYFKRYNDRYGHPAGDRALRLVATALQACCRQSDFVARYGGEEFMIVWQDIKNPVPLLESVGNAIRRLDIAHDASPTGQITVSCGCAVFDATHPNLSAAWLIQQSDEALYEAKSLGRNRYVVREIGR
ncbi:diguanylate cyclase [Pararobbsia silviterrae]|uniref:sensor domain-containing diguanylate cyclase n=1 Tax=Pararobbsia silviterrae TaxID=1792498 RepID=UPI00131430FC|nr:diguanylate cyclase [Pararobbsia silviterrae]